MRIENNIGSSLPPAPVEVLFQYFDELVALNTFAMAAVETAKQLGRDLDVDELREKKTAIRERYCTKRPRKTDGVVSYGVLETRAYDRSNIVVESEDPQSKSCVLITVRNSVLRERWRFKLVLREDRWLIDSLQFREGRKWSSVPIP